MRRAHLFFTQRLPDRTHQLSFIEWLEQAGNRFDFAHGLSGSSSSKPLIMIVGKCRPEAAILRQSSIPLIPGIQTSYNRHTLPAGNSLASNSSVR
jgi:hypothetical protein